MDTATLTLTDFLLARIAEDEAAAKSNEYEVAAHSSRCGYDQLEFGHDCTCRWPARALAECEAKRRIVEECRMLIHSFGDWDATPGAPASWPDVSRRERSQAHGRLRALASIYADHPDFRDEWRP